MRKLLLMSFVLSALLLGACSNTTVVTTEKSESESVVDTVSDNEVTSDDTVSSNGLDMESAAGKEYGNDNVKVSFDDSFDFDHVESILYGSTEDGVETLAVVTRKTGELISQDSYTVASDDYIEETFIVEYVSADKKDYCNTNVLGESVRLNLEAYMPEEDFSDLLSCYGVAKSNLSVTPLSCSGFDFELNHNTIDFSKAYTNKFPLLDTNIVNAYCELSNGDYLHLIYSYSDSVLFNAKLPVVEKVLLAGEEIITLSDEEYNECLVNIDLYNSRFENLELSVAEILKHVSIKE